MCNGSDIDVDYQKLNWGKNIHYSSYALFITFFTFLHRYLYEYGFHVYFNAIHTTTLLTITAIKPYHGSW